MTAHCFNCADTIDKRTKGWKPISEQNVKKLSDGSYGLAYDWWYVCTKCLG